MINRWASESRGYLPMDEGLLGPSSQEGFTRNENLCVCCARKQTLDAHQKVYGREVQVYVKAAQEEHHTSGGIFLRSLSYYTINKISERFYTINKISERLIQLCLKRHKNESKVNIEKLNVKHRKGTLRNIR